MLTSASASFGTYDCTYFVYVSVFGVALTVFALLQLRIVSFQYASIYFDCRELGNKEFV